MYPGHCYLVDISGSTFLSKVVSVELDTYQLESIEIEPSVCVENNFYVEGEIQEIQDVPMRIYEKAEKLFKDSLAAIQSACELGPIETRRLDVGYCFSYCDFDYTVLVQVTKDDGNRFQDGRLNDGNHQRTS